MTDVPLVHGYPDLLMELKLMIHYGGPDGVDHPAQLLLEVDRRKNNRIIFISALPIHRASIQMEG
ncbi:hypothetical protein D3C71_2193780 [compost metagenome]